ncbi:MAG: prolipoprotein diacylglyceryl transferase family protein, partial [Candidatus Omnitrophota bacterium]
MHPILLKFGVLTIYSYGVCLASGFIIAALLAKAEARRQNISPEKILDIALSALVSGILGARILYVAQNLSYYTQFPAEILMLQKGGLSFYGGFLTAILWVIISLKKAGLAVFKVLDIYAPYIALAQA